MKEFHNFTIHEQAQEGLEPFIEKFIDKRFYDLKTIRAALSQQRYEDVKKILHMWEGFSEPYGFGGLIVFSARFRDALNLQNSDAFESILVECECYLNFKKEEFYELDKRD